MSLSANFPAIRPSLLLDFANTKALDPRITFTRNTTATYYDGVTTAMAEQNLFTYSQQLNQWSVTAATATADATTAPDGTATADKGIATATTGYHAVVQGINFLSGTSYTISVYAKSAEYTKLKIADTTSGTYAAEYDLTAGTLIVLSAGTAASITRDATTGWCRCVLTFTSPSATFRGVGLIGYPDTGVTQTVNGAQYTGDGTSGIYLWGAQLEQRSSVTAYTATTTAAITNYIPVLKTAAANVARFDHNPTTSESLGLLVEEQRTNLLTYSSEFDNAAWAKPNATITANTVVAPDGTLTGDALIPTTSVNLGRYANQDTAITSGATYTQTVYAKANGTYALQLAGSNAFNTAQYINFDLNTGVVGGSLGASGTITAVGNGWYRCSGTFVATGTSTGRILIAVVPTASSTRVETFTGDGYSGVFIWGAQLEAGAFATSYIPTVASQVPRLADTATMTGTNFSSWFSNAAGSIYSEFDSPGIATGGSSVIYTLATNPGGALNALPQTDILTGGTVRSIFTGPTGSAVGTINRTTYTFGSVAKHAMSYSTTSASASLNAQAVGTTALSATPTPDRLAIGGVTGVAQNLCGHIRKLAYYPIRVTDAQLQALTS